MLEVTAFARPRDYGEHFKARYGPDDRNPAHAAKQGRAQEFDAALDAFCEVEPRHLRARASSWSTWSGEQLAV